MLTTKFISRLCLLHRATSSLQSCGEIFRSPVQRVLPAYWSSLKERSYSTAADNRSPPQWLQLEPELEEALVPRKLSVSPLESWLSLRYSLPPLLESAPPQEDLETLEEKVLPPMLVPVLEDGEGSVTPLKCKNDIEIRRRRMNRHKYKKLKKRTKFSRMKVLESRGRRKQKKFEKELERVWKRAGLKQAPEKWRTPKIYLKQHIKNND